MSYPSKAWPILICLVSYFCMGQAGCQTLSNDDTMYIRSDMVRIKRDVAEIKQQLDAPTAAAGRDVLRNQAAQRETLEELKEGQQRTESKIEEARYEIAVLTQEVTNLKLNLINQMEALRAANRGGVSQPSQYTSPPPVTQVPKPVAPVAVQPVAPPAPIVKPSMPAPTAPAVTASPVTAPVPSVQPSKPIDYTKLYDTAYEDYVRKNYALARNGFEEYLRQFPDTDLADNAQYWIGECYYAEGDYEKAASAFKMVITQYPTGNKVPRAMLKAGFALLEMGRTDQAKAMFHQVIDAYPLSTEADQARTKLKKL